MYNGMGEDNKKWKYIVGEIHAIIEYSTMTGVGLYQIPIMWKHVIIVESTRWSALYNVTCAIISLNDCLFRATKRSVSRSFRLRRRMDVALANSLSITTGRVMRGRPSQPRFCRWKYAVMLTCAGVASGRRRIWPNSFHRALLLRTDIGSALQRVYRSVLVIISG